MMGAIGAMVRRHPTLALGLLALAVMAAVALLAPAIAPFGPTQMIPAKRLHFPSADAWFGTDRFGQDVFSRTLFGARVSLMVGVSVAAISLSLGLVIGLIAGANRLVDALLMRMMDGLMSIPPVLLAIALMALTKASVKNVIIAISLTEIPRVARLVRGIVLTLRERPFVEAAIAAGTRQLRLLSRHILPNTLAPVLVQGTYITASAMITEAVLSFIGAGTPTDIPSWGNMMAEGRQVFPIAPYIIIFPGIFLALTVLAVNMVGDGLRDALDPRLLRVGGLKSA